MFIFRNTTIEHLFSNSENYIFSGYSDISHIPDNENELCWLYFITTHYGEVNALREIENIKNGLDYVLSNLKSDQIIYIFSIESILYKNISGSDFPVTDALHNLNKTIYLKSLEDRRVKYISLSPFLSKVPLSEIFAPKYHYTSSILINPNFKDCFNQYFQKSLSAIKKGREKKVLILDLDNTLWGGVLGEDGQSGICIGNSYPGNIFSDFQKAILELHNAGVLIAICSKNNYEDVIDVLENHPSMLLKPEHFVAIKANWNAKKDNITELANELNLGLDSFVFVDDSDFERESVKKYIPAVTVPDFPSKIYDLKNYYDNIIIDYFYAYEINQDDKVKNQQYKENFLRSELKSKNTNIDDYLRDLEIKIEVKLLNDFFLQRCAQMTQKTNQFNLTTQRYSEADLLTKLKNGDLLYTMKYQDKFGDSGVTGFAIVTPLKNDGEAEVDTYLLSCRVLGRKVEYAFISEIISHLRKLGFKTLKSKYIKSPKNQQVSDFFDNLGFQRISHSNQETQYSLILEKNIDNTVKFVNVNGI